MRKRQLELKPKPKPSIHTAADTKLSRQAPIMLLLLQSWARKEDDGWITPRSLCPHGDLVGTLVGPVQARSDLQVREHSVL
jgi:hypothetical protein